MTAKKKIIKKKIRKVGRPSLGLTSSISVSMSEEMKLAVGEQANSRGGASDNSWIREAIQEKLDRDTKKTNTKSR